MMRRVLRPAIAVALCLGVLSACGGSGTTTVTAQFDDAAGLFEGNDVGVLGVRVGEVTSITPRGDHVDVDLRIDPGVKIQPMPERSSSPGPWPRTATSS